jgi:hypothetical protein
LLQEIVTKVERSNVQQKYNKESQQKLLQKFESVNKTKTILKNFKREWNDIVKLSQKVKSFNTCETILKL